MNILRKFISVRRHARLFITVVLLLAIWMLWPNDNDREKLRLPELTTTTSQQCLELRPEFGSYQEAYVREPGTYCIATDFWQQRLSNGAGHSGPAPHHNLIEVGTGDVTLDLMNHILHSDGHSSGVAAFVESNKGSAWYSKSLFGLETKNVIIKNGVIDLRGLGRGVVLIRHWGMADITDPVPGKLKDYEKSKFTLENVLIKTDNVGIILEGDGNVIRNCIIESGGNAAIMMAGPNGKIINNKIMLTNPFFPTDFANETGIPNVFSRFLDERRLSRAAIVLHQATGTVISGNRIEVRGKSETRHNIYLNHGSKGVRIEGNTFVGVGDPVTLVDGSTAELKNNVFEKKKASWWQF